MTKNNFSNTKKKKNSERGYGSNPIHEKFFFRENEAKYYKLRDYILEKTYRIKIFLILGIKEITWRKELENKYDINPARITLFFEFMKEEGFIYHRLLTEVDSILFESVIKLHNNHFYGNRDNIKVYTLTPLGKDLISNLLEDIKHIIDTREDLKNDIDYINKEVHKHKLLLDSIRHEEENSYKRTIIYPDGTEIEKNTLKYNRDKDLIKTLHFESLEALEKKGLLTDKSKNALMVAKKKELALDSKLKGIIRPKPIKLKLKDFEVKEISENDIKKLQRESEKEAKAKIESLNKEALDDNFNNYLIKSIGYKLSTTKKDEGLKFLDSL